MFKKFFSIFLSALTIMAGITLLNPAYAKNTKIKISASFYPMYFFASQIGGNKVQVRTLIPSGTEPHDWAPKISDIKYVCKSDIFIYNGAGMESWASKVINQAGDKLISVNASKGVTLIKNKDKDEIKEHGNADPHIWNSLRCAKIEAKNIKNALIKVDSKDKKYFEKNYNTLVKKLSSLDKEFSKKLEHTKINKIVTAHAAFSYLCRDYGFKQVSIEGTFAEGEPSPKKMADIINFCNKNKIKYIFSEELLSPKTAQTIASECGAKNLVLNPLESAGKGQDYFSIMKHNLNYIVKASK